MESLWNIGHSKFSALLATSAPSLSSEFLYNAWESCTAHFYRMTMAEATKWSNERHSTSSLSPSESGSRDTAVNTSEQDLSDQNNTIPTDGATVNTSEQDLSDWNNINNITISTDNATTVTTSEQVSNRNNTISTDNVTSVNDPSSNLNLSSSAVSATVSSGKRAQATEAQSAPPNKRHCQELMPAFIDVITSVDGSTVMNKKPRRARSDKGEKRVKWAFPTYHTHIIVLFCFIWNFNKCYHFKQY